MTGRQATGRQVRILAVLGLALTLTAGACPSEFDPDTPTYQGTSWTSTTSSEVAPTSTGEQIPPGVSEG